MTDLVPLAHIAPLDLALVAWLHAKSARTNSAKTKRAYTSTMTSFRQALASANLALDNDAALVATVAQGWASTGDPAAATYNQRLAIISSFYSFARKRGLLDSENPLSRVERRPVQHYANALAQRPAELRAALAAIDRSTLMGQRDHALLSVALVTGRRVGELAALRWGDLQLTREEQVTLTFNRTKGGKTQRDTLPAAVGALLLRYLRAVHHIELAVLPKDAAVWVSLSRQNKGQPLHPNWLERIARARLDVHFHALRHAFARALEDTGAKVSEIQARLGHESLQTTGRYLAALRRDDNPHADQLAALFGLDETR